MSKINCFYTIRILTSVHDTGGIDSIDTIDFGITAQKNFFISFMATSYHWFNTFFWTSKQHESIFRQAYLFDFWTIPLNNSFVIKSSKKNNVANLHWMNQNYFMVGSSVDHGSATGPCIWSSLLSSSSLYCHLYPPFYQTRLWHGGYYLQLKEIIINRLMLPYQIMFIFLQRETVTSTTNSKSYSATDDLFPPTFSQFCPFWKATCGRILFDQMIDNGIWLTKFVVVIISGITYIWISHTGCQNSQAPSGKHIYVLSVYIIAQSQNQILNQQVVQHIYNALLLVRHTTYKNEFKINFVTIKIFLMCPGSFHCLCLDKDCKEFLNSTC